MIIVENQMLAGDTMDRFSSMMDGPVMKLFISHMEHSRDAATAESGCLSFHGRKHEADQKMKLAHDLDVTIKTLNRYAAGELTIGSVKILTRA